MSLNKMHYQLLSYIILFIVLFFCKNTIANNNLSQISDSTDLVLVEIIMPETQSYCALSDIVRIKIANTGPNPVSGFDLVYDYYKLTSPPTNFDTVMETYNDVLIPGDTVEYTFTQSPPNAGVLYLTSYIVCPTDTNPANNSLSQTVGSWDVLMLTGLEINDNPISSSIDYSSHKEEWFFYIYDHDWAEICISLCGSSFDTKLYLYECSGQVLCAYNDDYCGLQSQVTIYNPEPKGYYAEVSGYGSAWGNYIIQMTGKRKQLINLPQGWSMFSSYITPDSLNMEQVFSSVINDISIIKDRNGNAFWPQYNVNLIGNFDNYEGYQVKTFNSTNLNITGQRILPDTCEIVLQPGWGIIPYLRTSQGEIETMLQSLDSAIIIVKDDSGAAYWPAYNVNLIENLYPGKGYQIKTSSLDTLIYPPNP